MFFTIYLRKNIKIMILIFIICAAAIGTVGIKQTIKTNADADFIKWVDFNVSYEALCDTMKVDIDSHGSDREYHWIELLSCLAVQNGNNFAKYTKKDLTKLLTKLENTTIEAYTQNMKYYGYYYEAFTAILGEYIGEYSIETENPQNPDEPIFEKKYGLKVFSPIAKNFGFEHYDDFANARSYGYKRKHTGHDMFGSIGTPVVAVESGTVESIGWNQYGGWRIGIRSFDKKRYYYYAHLRKDHPYTPLMQEGAVVKAGDVIGYLGMTGYSTKENVNNINVPHLHFGIQLIFDESQKDGSAEIWVDGYNIVKLLQKNRSPVYKEEKEYYRQYDFDEPLLNQMQTAGKE